MADKTWQQIFEEVQHITEGNISSYQAADVIKIVAKCKVQVVCVGMHSMLNLVEGENANSQLQRLKMIYCRVDPLPCSLDDFFAGDLKAIDPKDIRFPDTPYVEFCRKLDDRSEEANIILPFDESSNISDPFVAIRIWMAWKGKVGEIMDFLFAATDLAIEKKRPMISLKVMEATFRQMGNDDSDNWFMMGVPVLIKRFGQRDPGAENEDANSPVQTSPRGHAPCMPRKRG